MYMCVCACIYIYIYIYIYQNIVCCFTGKISIFQSCNLLNKKIEIGG